MVVCGMGASIYFIVWSVSSLSYTPRAGICSSGQGSLLIVPYCNLSRCSAGGDFLPGRMSGGE